MEAIAIAGRSKNMNQLTKKKWWIAAGTRTIKTFAEAVLSMLTIGQAVMDVNWINVLSVAAGAALIAFMTCLAGLPEVEE